MAVWTLVGCAGSPSASSRDVKVDENYRGGALSRILVMAVMPDERHDSRVIVERAFAQKMQAAGVEAVAGYTRFDSVDALLAEPDSFDPQVKDLGVEAVLILDPIRLDTDYNPQEYDDRRTLYRAIGFEYSESAALWGKIAHQASAAKVVMNVGLWQPGSKGDLWNSTYDLNAPDNHDPDMARNYSLTFADLVIADLRAKGLIR